MLLITSWVAGVMAVHGHRGIDKVFAAVRRWVDRAEFDTVPRR